MKIYNLVGIGIGPSNLSTAALLNPLGDKINTIFFDNKVQFNWHPGLMFPDAKLQVSILKDLVSMLDPTNEFSFLNYLKENRKLYIFAARNGFNNVKRKEFEDYLKWAVSKLDNLHFNSPVEDISYKENHFEIKVNNQIYKSKNVLMGAGLTAKIPEFCREYISSSCFHSSQFLKEYNNYSGKIVTIIGGGQSSCEILKFILEQDEDKLPSKINWIIRSHKLNVLENTPFANELYTPNYSQFIYSLDSKTKDKLFKEQKSTSDGVSEETLNEIYDLLYQNELHKTFEISIHNDSSFNNVKKIGKSYFLSINEDLTIESDIIVLGTGFEYKIPKCIEKLSDLYETVNGVFKVDEQYRLVPKTELAGTIYIHNGAKHIRGVADPNLSLLAWRSGVIINALLGDNIYSVNEEKSLLQWTNI